jgi:hypothetical protein
MQVFQFAEIERGNATREIGFRRRYNGRNNGQSAIENKKFLGESWEHHNTDSIVPCCPERVRSQKGP